MVKIASGSRRHTSDSSNELDDETTTASQAKVAFLSRKMSSLDEREWGEKQSRCESERRGEAEMNELRREPLVIIVAFGFFPTGGTINAENQPLRGQRPRGQKGKKA